MDKRGFVSRANLFYHFILHWIRRVIGIRGGGLPEFLRDFSKEGILPIPEDGEGVLLMLGRCLNCGNCNPPLEPLILKGFPSGEEIISSLTRSFPDLRFGFPHPASPPELKDASALCPAGIELDLACRFLLRLAGKGEDIPAPNA